MDSEYHQLIFKIMAEDRTAAVWRSLWSQVQHLRAGLKELHQSTGQAASVTNTLAGAVRGTFGVFRTLLSPVLGMVKSLIGSVFDLVKSIGGALWGAVSKVFGYLAGAAKIGLVGLAGAMTLLAKQGVAVNATLERLTIGFATMFRSSSKASGFLSSLRRDAEKSGTSFLDMAQQAQRLMAFGFSPNESRGIGKVLRDTTRGLGGDAGTMDRLVLAMGQIRAKGTLQGDEVMQLTEAGINVRQILGIKPGQDIGRLAIPSAQALPRLISGLQAQFGGLDEQIASVTASGRWDNIMDVIQRLSGFVTGGLYESFRKAAGSVLEFVGNLEKTKSGRIILGTIKSAFDMVGRGVENLAGKLPQAADSLASFLASDRFQNWKNIASNAVSSVWDAVRAGADWISANWANIWNTARDATLGAMRTIGGVIAGTVAQLKAFFDTNRDGRVTLQELGNSFKELAVVAVSALSKVSQHVFTIYRNVGLLVTALGLFLSIWGQTRAIGAQFVARGGTMAVMGQAATWATARGEKQSVNAIRGLDTSAIARAFGNQGASTSNETPFQRGRREFEEGWDTWIAGLSSPRSGASSPLAAARQYSAPGGVAQFDRAPGSVSGMVPPMAGSVAGAIGAQGTEGEGKKSLLETIRDIRQNVLGKLDKQIEAFRAWMDASPENTHSRITRNYLLPLTQKRMRLLSTYTGPIGSNSWWDDVSEFQRTRSQYNELQESLKPKASEAPKAPEMPSTMKPGVRMPKMARVLGGWMPVPGSEEVVTAPVQAAPAPSSGQVVVGPFYINAENAPEQIKQIVENVMYSLRQRAYAGS